MAFDKYYPTTFSISFSEEQDRCRKVFAEGYRVGGDFKVKEGTIKNYCRTRGIKQDSSGLIRTDICVGTGMNNGRACVGPNQSGLLVFVKYCLCDFG